MPAVERIAMDSIKPQDAGPRRMIERMDAPTDPAFGSRPENRSIPCLLESCIVVLDKRTGITSREALDEAAEAIGTREAGHSGTLDPAVTGVLPIGVGSGLKLLDLLLEAGKEYEGALEVHERGGGDALRRAAADFVGEITQTPPVKSRVKRLPRKRMVYFFEITSHSGRKAEFRCGVEAGTYIRKLVHDIGMAVGCGAHMTRLRRTRAGPFLARDAVGIEELRAAMEGWRARGEETLRRHLRPIEEAAAFLPRVWAADGAIHRILSGSPLFLPGLVKFEAGIRRGDKVAIMTLKDEIAATGTAVMDEGEMASGERGAAVKVAKTVMKKGVYPLFRDQQE